MKVFVASAGFEDCEAFVSVAGPDEGSVMHALTESIRSTALLYEDEEKSAEEIEEEVWFVGPMLEDTDTLDLTAAQLQELLGGWVATVDAGDGSMVGHTDVLATEAEAREVYDEWRRDYPKGIVELRQVPAGITYLDTD
jgi:hypothetical protein